VVPSFYVVFEGIAEWLRPVRASAVSGDKVEKIQTGD